MIHDAIAHHTWWERPNQSHVKIVSFFVRVNICCCCRSRKWITCCKRQIHCANVIAKKSAHCKCILKCPIDWIQVSAYVCVCLKNKRAKSNQTTAKHANLCTVRFVCKLYLVCIVDATRFRRYGVNSVCYVLSQLQCHFVCFVLFYSVEFTFKLVVAPLRRSLIR